MQNTYNFVETGGNKKGFLQTEKHVDMDVLKKIKEDWEKLYSNEGHSIVVLNDGLKFTESSNTSVEMQLNESIKRNNDLVCEMFGLSPKIISGAASDDEYVTAIKTAVMPIVAAFQSALNTGMLLPSERGTYYFAFDMKQLLKGDILKRYQAYRIALQSRFMQPNEVRYEEDFEPYEYDFITLGLSDVLLDLKNKTIYTPNTNQTVKFGEAASLKSIDNHTANAIIEDRYNDGSNYTKDEHGRFTGSTGTGGGSGGGGGSSGGGKNRKGSKKRKNQPKMSSKELYWVTHGIATDFPKLKPDGVKRLYEYGDYSYTFYVKDFGNYRFISKEKLK